MGRAVVLAFVVGLCVAVGYVAAPVAKVSAFCSDCEGCDVAAVNECTQIEDGMLAYKILVQERICDEDLGPGEGYQSPGPHGCAYHKIWADEYLGPVTCGGPGDVLLANSHYEGDTVCAAGVNCD